jgi:hypothetical protein
MVKKDESKQIPRTECGRIGAEVDREQTETVSVNIQELIRPIEESSGDQGSA